jgi:hypothetical protein
MTALKGLKPSKPYMLRRWRIGLGPNCHHFFTCARPGRTGDPKSKNVPVPDELVHRWVLGLPGPQTSIVSLLGRKPDGRSEFSFYSFYGGFDFASEHRGRLSFQEWITKWHEDSFINVREHPTCDFKAITTQNLDAIASDIRQLLSAGRTVVVIDSGGQTRTGQVCNHLRAVENSGTDSR